MLKHLPRLDGEILHQNPWWEYRRDRYLRPDDSEGEYYYIRTPGSVAILPILEDGRIVLVKQFRYLNQRECIEFLGGGMQRGKSARESAEAELREEGGLIAEEWIELTPFNPMNGATDEYCYPFIAKKLSEVGAEPEPSEEFEHVLMSPADLEASIASGEIWDGMTLAVWSLARKHLL